jgi:3-oxoacyl-[acyl-carrier protein] reductase
MTAERKVAWVTGGGRNIGRAVCLAFAAAGFDVVSIGHRRPQEVASVADEVRGLGAEALHLTADLGDGAAVRTAAAAALERFGRVDVLVNNAAWRAHAGFLELTEDEWRQVLEVNLTGVFRWCKAAVPSMVERGSGAIINVSGTAIYTGRAAGAASVSARSGVLGLTRNLALELGPHGVRANSVVLGRIDTVREVPTPPEEEVRLVRRIPLRRSGRPDEVAAVCVFLASEAAAYITGQSVHVNGGSLLAS